MENRTDRADVRLRCSFNARESGLSGVTVRAAVLNILTLGLYRLKGANQVNQALANSVEIEGEALEWSSSDNTGISGLAGIILVWATALAIALIVLGATRTLASDSDFLMPKAALAGIAVLLAVPSLASISKYNKVRSLNSMTWRGTGFGVTPGAAGYAFRSAGLFFLTLLSLGLLLPYQTYWKEQYLRERVFYGKRHLQLTVRWPALFPAMAHLAFAAVLGVAVTVMVRFVNIPEMSVLGIVPALWAAWGWARYRVHSDHILNTATLVDGNLRLESRGSVLWQSLTVLLGGFVSTLVFVCGVTAIWSVSMTLTTTDPNSATTTTLVLFLMSIVVLELIALSHTLLIRQPLMSARYDGLVLKQSRSE